MYTYVLKKENKAELRKYNGLLLVNMYKISTNKKKMDQIAIINLLKENRTNFFEYQFKFNRNMTLCLLGTTLDKETIKSLRAGWQEAVAYFPHEKMSFCERNVIENENTPSYSMAGVTFLGGKIMYFAASRINIGKKMTAKQRNSDHRYFNQKINVFETEEQFVAHVCSSEDFVGEEMPIDTICRIFRENIEKSLSHHPHEKGADVKDFSISDGVLTINPIASLRDQIVQ
ncbi:MAG: hypothetical protein NTY80_02275 [candidate division SR1 bacterium]|nr:hypothetical protein [candidate division SR1 bacterium]